MSSPKVAAVVLAITIPEPLGYIDNPNYVKALAPLYLFVISASAGTTTLRP